MENFEKKKSGSKLSTSITKFFILNVCRGPDYADSVTLDYRFLLPALGLAVRY